MHHLRPASGLALALGMSCVGTVEKLGSPQDAASFEPLPALVDHVFIPQDAGARLFVPDAGAPVDAGVDAGTRRDAGVTLDAGLVDAGPPPPPPDAGPCTPLSGTVTSRTAARTASPATSSSPPA